MFFVDSETTGYHGPIILIQWAKDNGPVVLHNVWTSPIVETLKLIEELMSDSICGFNISFEMFHFSQTYNTLELLLNKVGPDACPEDHIDLYAVLEEKARDGKCLKPKSACDLMLHARKGPYQSTMARDDIRVRRVPTSLAWYLASDLEQRIPLSDIYFAKRKNKFDQKWKVYDIVGTKDFKDVVLKFAPSSALKVLAIDALGLEPDTTLLFADVECSEKPVEAGWAPYAMAIGKPGKWNGAWPDVIRHHIRHWGYNELARKYAEKDVLYLQLLYPKFGSPEPGDHDSELACMVGTSRWKGFKIDVEGIKSLKKIEKEKRGRTPRDPRRVYKYLVEVMDEVEKLSLKDEHDIISTKKVVLKQIETWKKEDGSPHPAAERAKEVLSARQAHYRIGIYDKLLQAGRLHADFNIIGAKSSRMSGASDFNSQGVEKRKDVRNKFPLAFDGEELCGGDFDSFEVTLTDAVYEDPNLHEDLISGKKLHAIVGTLIYPGWTYEQILASSGTDDDKYTKAKSAFFALIYFGEGYTLKTRLGVDIEVAEAAVKNIMTRYKVMGKKREWFRDNFCPMQQPGGIGSRVIWKEPADYVESLFGFKRFFTLENRICRALFDLANRPPKAWANIKVKVSRREGRVQTASGAVQSALYGAAFQLQGANMRAAGNHKIQSSGAQLTKEVQDAIWKLQPSGIHEWVVRPMNIHDEIMCPTKPCLVKDVDKIVNDFIARRKKDVPLLGMKWKSGLTSWAGK